MKSTKLVAKAEELLPGSTLAATLTYTDFRTALFAEYKAAWGHLSQVDRLHEGLRSAYRMVGTHPWWGQVVGEIEAALERSMS